MGKQNERHRHSNGRPHADAVVTMVGHPEDALQAAVVTTLRLSPDIKVFAVPNGGRRNAREAARMKGQGVTAGVLDLVVLWPSGGFAMIELKAPGRVTGKKRPLAALSPEQLGFYGWLQINGHHATICDSVAGVEAFLRSVGAPVTTRTQGVS